MSSVSSSSSTGVLSQGVNLPSVGNYDRLSSNPKKIIKAIVDEKKNNGI